MQCDVGAWNEACNRVMKKPLWWLVHQLSGERRVEKSLYNVRSDK